MNESPDSAPAGCTATTNPDGTEEVTTTDAVCVSVVAPFTVAPIVIDPEALALTVPVA